ncbi:hypothetical protein quinque_000318 [Culex quinquefasciatus]
MAYSGRNLTIFTLVTCFASTVAVRYSLVNYIVATINHLATAETAVPKVVFYDLSARNPFHDGLLGRVIRDPRLDSSVSRIVISCGANMDQTYPSLQKLGIMHTEVDEMLHFADLTPAWMGLLGGLIIAGVAFGLELALFKIVESLNEDTGRVMVKFAIGGNRDYVNEYLLQLVSRAEFDQYGKVLNKEKYEEYKKRQDNDKTATSEEPRLQRELKKESPPPRVTSREDRTQQHSSRSQHREDRDREDRHSRQDRDRDDRRRDSSTSEDDSRHRSHHKPSRTSSGTKKKSHKYKQHRREYSRERERGSRDREWNHRRGSSDDDEETRRRDAHKQKKTKKSKRQRSRSR